MAAGDLTGFASAGRRLAEAGLVHASEGNLSTFDGRRLTITRTGSRLDGLGAGDVLVGTLEDPPSGASSDLALHLAVYRERGPGAYAHAHPAGSVPPGWVEGMPHGVYAFAPTLGAAVDELLGGAGS